MNKRKIALGPGAASLILIVVVLSLCMMAMLTQISARNDYNLCARSAEMVQRVYELNARSEQKLAELDALLAAGLPESATSMQAIGYKELLRERRGEITREQAFDDIKRGSRNYAKRQLTWLRRNPEVHWISLGAEPDFEEVYRRAAAILAEAGFPGAEAIFSAPT